MSRGVRFLLFGHYLHFEAYAPEKLANFLYVWIELPARDFRYPFLGVAQFLAKPCLAPTAGPHNGF